MTERRDDMSRGPDAGEEQRDARLGEALAALPVPELSEGFYHRLLAAVAAENEARQHVPPVESEGDEPVAFARTDHVEQIGETRDELLGRQLDALPVPELSENFYTRLAATIEAADGAPADAGEVVSLDVVRAARHRRVTTWLRVAAVAACIAAVAAIAATLWGSGGPRTPSPGPPVATRDVPEIALLQYRIPRRLAVRDYSDRFAVLAAPAHAKKSTGALAVLDFENGKVSHLLTKPVHGESGWRIDGVRVSDTWVVWQETGGSAADPSYALYAAPILTGPALGRARLVAERRAAPSGGAKTKLPFTFAVSGDYVVYDVPTLAAPGGPATKPTPAATASPTATSPRPSPSPSATSSATPSASPTPSPSVSTTPPTTASEELPAGGHPTAAPTAPPSAPRAETAPAATPAARPPAPSTRPRLHWELVSKDLRGGRVTTLATTAVRPVFALDHDQVVLRPRSTDGFVRLDLRTGKRLSHVRVVLPPRTRVSAFAVEAGWTAWIQSASATPGSGGVLVARDPQGSLYHLGTGLSSPWFANGYLLFEAAHGALWAFDLVKRVPVRLGEPSTGAGLLLRVESAGRTLVERASHSSTGIVTLYRLAPAGGLSGTPAPTASAAD